MEDIESLRITEAVDAAMATIGTVYERMPVLNREARTNPEENRALWGALMRRDGGKCWMCGRADDFMVIDHLTPRSSFPADQLDVADRSDNLSIACWDCNQDKSNRAFPFRKPLGIVWHCQLDWRLEGVDEDDAEAWLEFYSAEDKRVFCAKHSCAVTVPADWRLAALG